VVEYRLFRKPTPDGEYEEVASAGTLEETRFRYRNQSSIAGCYAVTAIDSAGNESEKSDSVCVDNCPVYELPNVFTPNGDGINELMKPVRSRYVKKVEMTVRNRWGQVVFETEDPELNWDGTNQNNGEPVSEGVYYYICRVHTLRLEGIKKIELTGQVQVLRGDPKKRP
jgi:gliding motility-associated-like protein